MQMKKNSLGGNKKVRALKKICMKIIILEFTNPTFFFLAEIQRNNYGIQELATIRARTR